MPLKYKIRHMFSQLSTVMMNAYSLEFHLSLNDSSRLCCKNIGLLMRYKFGFRIILAGENNTQAVTSIRPESTPILSVCAFHGRSHFVDTFHT